MNTIDTIDELPRSHQQRLHNRTKNSILRYFNYDAKAEDMMRTQKIFVLIATNRSIFKGLKMTPKQKFFFSFLAPKSPDFFIFSAERILRSRCCRAKEKTSADFFHRRRTNDLYSECFGVGIGIVFSLLLYTNSLSLSTLRFSSDC